MNSIAQTLIASYAFTNNLIDTVTEDLTPEHLLKRTRDGAGPSLLWTIGHMYEYRRRALKAMDIESDDRYESMFLEAAATEGAEYPSLEELLGAWNDLWPTLESALSEQSNDAFVDAEGKKTRLFNGMIFSTWHEASHMGSLSTMRKELGYPSSSEAIIDRIRKEKEAKEKEAAEAGSDQS